MKTVIGLFDDHQEAQQAFRQLTSNGFSRQEATITRDTDSPTVRELLSDARIPQGDIDFYHEGVSQGGSLVVVRTDDSKARQAADILSQFDMVDVDSRMTQFQQSGRNDLRLSNLDEEGAVIPIVEEELQVGKRQVQRGGVRIHTEMTERPVEEQVTLRDETVRVERRPVDRAVSDADFNTFKEGTFEVTETSEEAVVSKQARVIEEVVVGKQVSEHTETIRDTVRRTDVNVEQLSGSEREVGRTTDFSRYDSDFRSYYNSNLKSSGYSYDQYSPVFRYGYGLANDDRYRNRQWNDIETDARRDWESKNPGTWEQFKDSVRYAWQRATGSR